MKENIAAEKLIDLSCRDFIKALSSKAPVPGGGGAVGLGGAMGIALVNMVLRLTSGKKKYAQYEAELQTLLAKGEALQEEILGFVAADAAAFAPLALAYALPKQREEEAAAKQAALSLAAIAACEVPLHAAERLLEALELNERVAEIGSMLAISDAACGAELLLAAIKCAEQNVLINLGSIKDAQYVHHAAVAIKRMVLAAEDSHSKVLKSIEAR